MKSIQHQLEDHLQQALNKAFPDLVTKDVLIAVMQSSQPQFGHYQCNSPMKLAKVLQKSPRQVAEGIINHLDLSVHPDSPIESVDIAGPGFINIKIKPDFLSKVIQKTLKIGPIGLPKTTKPQRVVIDFSSPNVAKEMHVGHIRSTIIGDSLSRLFEFLGDDVLRLNHVGDWGTSFGMLITYLKEREPEVFSGNQPTDLTHLMGWYRASKKVFDEDEEFKKRAQRQVVALQQGDLEALRAWRLICEISEKAYQEIYKLLDVRITTRGESFYNPLLLPLVNDLQKKGLLELSDGAKCMFLEGFQTREGTPLPLILQKSDGGFNYATTDLAALRHRIEEEKADRVIYVIDLGQSTHLQMVFQAAVKAGYWDPKKVRVDHVGFGLVLGPDGKKFKTRSGDSEKLIDLLTQAVDEAEKILNERSPSMDIQERKKLAHALGIGAVKYSDLSTNRTGDYQFSYEKMLRFEGNTAAFIMYAYVRVAGIKRKVQQDIDLLIAQGSIHLSHPSEIALALQVAQFGEVLEQITVDLMPNHLTDYLYGLADRFHAFFRDCRVEGSSEQRDRLLLCEAVARTMKQGLEILGIPIVDKM